MPSHLHADHPAAQPPERGVLDALISQTRRLRGGIDAVRRGTAGPYDDADDPRSRWQRALCQLAVRQLDDLGGHLDQLREGVPAEPARTAVVAGPSTALTAPPCPSPGGDSGTSPAAGDDSTGTGTTAEGSGTGAHRTGGPASSTAAPATPAAPYADGGAVPPATRVGSAEWNLLTDEVSWSEELYALFGRTAQDGPLSLDELPSWVPEEDQPVLTAAVTDCLIDGRPIDREFRILRPDGAERTVHMVGEPVLDDDGGTASMWAVLRDVSALRRSERAVRETRDSLRQEQHMARTEHRVAVEFQEAVLPPWRGPLRLSHGTAGAGGALDLASHYLPSATSALIGGDWYDALELPDGTTLLSAGDLTGHGVAATSGMAMLLGAVRGMAVAGVEPGTLMGHLNQLLDSAAQPALGSAVCCRYAPCTGTLTWAQAGHPAPLLFRGGAGRVLRPPEGVLLGVTSGAAYGQRTEQLRPGDVLVLHTDGLAPRSARLDAEEDEPQTGADRLLGLAPRFATARTAQECIRAVLEAFGDREREDDACVLIARVSD